MFKFLGNSTFRDGAASKNVAIGCRNGRKLFPALRNLRPSNQAFQTERIRTQQIPNRASQLPQAHVHLVMN
jgi:hypothetical protein